ncbi:MAG: rod shape-determining protein MreC [Bacteroidia bacterium]
MRNLFLFLWKYNFLILFLLLETLCGYLIVQNNNFQRASFINSTNQVATKVNSTVSSITEYINLRFTNDALSRENAALRTMMPSVFYIDSAVRRNVTDTTLNQQYTFLTAKVINNSTNRRNNYLTLDRGSNQGVMPGQGVICPQGVVGVVKDVSDHFCTVMSFLHKSSKISARIKRTEFIGSMQWEGIDATHGTLSDIENHVKVQKGDTIITTEFSKRYPEGVLIGIVDKVESGKGSTFQDISVKLSTEFGNLTYVYIVSNLFKAELDSLEKPVEEEQRALEGSGR